TFKTDPAERHRKCGDARRVLFVGRVSPEKGVHLLVTAFAKVLQVCPDVVLDIVGPHVCPPLNFLVGLSDDQLVASLESFYEEGKGSYLEQVKYLIAPRMADNVRLLGGCLYSEVVAHYRSADVFAIASYSDAFPLPALEAMANGVPIVGARVGGIKELVVH